VADYGKGKNPDIIIEGELGILRGSSTIQQSVEVKKEDLADPAQVKEFVAATGVDLIAPAVGNIHGVTSVSQPKLFIDLIKKIKQASGDCGLVLHGASGIEKQDFIDAIKNGINVVHFNTDLRVGYTKGIREFFAENPDEVVPYKYLSAGTEAAKALIEEKIKLLGSAGKI
jgi:fructose-bisphosphate aldolase class II